KHRLDRSGAVGGGIPRPGNGAGPRGRIASMQRSTLIIITGHSGAGKGTLLRALEDRGFFCVDNLPVELLGKFVELLGASEGDVQRAALVVDIREGQALGKFPLEYE